MLKRKEYLVDLTKADLLMEDREEVFDGQGNLFSSEMLGQPMYHLPTLDIDLECELIDSTTPGHYHLYIDKPLSWDEYKMLLECLREVGIIQKGFYELSLARGATFLRKPGVKKDPNDVGDS